MSETPEVAVSTNPPPLPDSAVAVGSGMAPAVPAAMLQRIAGQFPETVVAGTTAQLTISIEHQPISDTDSGASATIVAQDGVDILLVLQCPGFLPLTDCWQALHISRDTAAPSATFPLQAQGVGKRSIEVTAYQNSQFLGTLAWNVAIVRPQGAEDGQALLSVPEPASVAMRQEDTLKPRKPDKYDVTVLVRYDTARGAYRFQLFSGLYVSEEAYSAPLLRPVQVAVEKLVEQLNQLATKQTAETDDEMRRWLKNQGIALWNEFVPRPIQEQFWEMRDCIRRLVIIASEVPIPWELMYPFQSGGRDAGFLVEQFPVVHWRASGQTPQQKLSVKTPCFVLPTDDFAPPSAKGEIQRLYRIVTGNDLPDNTVIPDLPRLLQAFDAGQFTLLHFSTHNNFSTDQPDANAIVIGEPPFELAYLNQYADAFTAAAPIVFLNACRSDGSAPLYTRVAGWANSFLDAGAGAFVGSLWEVGDEAAAGFAVAFYSALLAGVNLGDAFTAARNAIKGISGDPTWLAYTLYGDPSAMLTKETDHA